MEMEKTKPIDCKLMFTLRQSGTIILCEITKFILFKLERTTMTTNQQETGNRADI